MKYLINNMKEIMLYGIYIKKHYHYCIINSIITLRFKLYKLAHDSIIASPTTGEIISLVVLYFMRSA